MTYYVVSIVRPCSEGGCTRNATVVVKNAKNEEIRKCCTAHGSRLARQLNDAEARDEASSGRDD